MSLERYKGFHTFTLPILCSIDEHPEGITDAVESQNLKSYPLAHLSKTIEQDGLFWHSCFASNRFVEFICVYGSQ